MSDSREKVKFFLRIMNEWKELGKLKFLIETVLFGYHEYGEPMKQNTLTAEKKLEAIIKYISTCNKAINEVRNKYV